MNAQIPLREELLEKLVADHQRLKKELGQDHILVQSLWAELRRRHEENMAVVD